MGFLFLKGDAGRIPLPDRSCDLVVGSPPYLFARSYLEDGKDLGIARGLDAWVSWMLRVTAEALRVSKGAVIWVAAGMTKDRNYLPACERLMSEWARGVPGSGVWEDGIELPLLSPSYCTTYRPVYWKRVGIPGSGGDQWFRSDVEHCMAFKRPGRLPWTDNTACGYPPKWAPGGAMSHRTTDGGRVGRLSHRTIKERMEDGTMYEQHYAAPAIANPGNVLEVVTGGGLLGHASAHENEAPYPMGVPEFFIRSLCPPGGRVLDVFSGSGTTASAALKHDRVGIGMDLRMSQCRLGKRRIERPPAPVPKVSKPERKYAFLDFEED